MNVRVDLIDDHRIFSAGLRSFLQQQGVSVVGTASCGEEGLRLSAELRPDVVVLDVSMPGLSGIETTRRLLSESPETRVIALSMYSDDRFVSSMLEAGAVGYLLKSSDPSELLVAIGAVLAGRRYLSPEVAGPVIEGYVKRAGTNTGSSALSARESQVLRLLAEGKTKQEIALLLGVGEATVDTYRRRISIKLRLHTLSDLVKYAIREGLTSPEA
ncbi:MAG: response regulator transcription factor [Deltaproteobacteria bacterium]|nr:response regulator transcription factor [Deltaproteobacteria bacterium]